jgi:outer membrane lipoprotein-sorting protein
MKTAVIITYICLSIYQAGGAAEAEDSHFVRAQLDRYKKIRTVSCRVRRTVESERRRVSFLSKVYYRTNDYLHAQTVSPYKRTVIADGRKFYSYVSGDSKCFARRVENLDKPYLISLRKIPATPMDHLLRLKEAKQTGLGPGGDYPERYGYSVTNAFVLVSVDKESRIRNITFFETRDMKNKTAETVYSQHKKAGEGLWIPTLHESKAYFNSRETTETVKYHNLEINKPIADSLFVPENFIPDVEFVKSFSDIQ